MNDSTLCALPIGCGLYDKPVVAAFLICLHTMNPNTLTVLVLLYFFVKLDYNFICSTLYLIMKQILYCYIILGGGDFFHLNQLGWGLGKI